MNAGLEQKSVWNWKLGDHIGAGSRVAKIVKVTKSTFRAEYIDTPGSFITLTSSGKKYGSKSYWHHVPDVDAYQQGITNKQAEIQAQKDAAEQRHLDRLTAARDANPIDKWDARCVTEGLELRKCEFVNKAGQPVIVFFEYETYDERRYDDQPNGGYTISTVKRVRLTELTAYTPSRLSGKHTFSMAMSGNDTGEGVYSALINALVNHWWD